MKNFTIGAAIIAKNEEKNVKRCLDSIKNVMDEIAVADTGSSDATMEICREFGVSVYSFDWNDDFSAARNFAVSKLTTDFVFVVDADEILLDDANGFEFLSKSPENVGGWLTEISSADPSNPSKILHSFKTVRIFRNDPEIRFEGAIHEQILPAINRKGLKIADSNVKTLHFGYDYSSETTKKKLERNLRIIEKELKKKPTDSFLLYCRAKTLADLGKIDKTKQTIEEILEKSTPLDEYYPRTLLLYAQLLTRQKEYDEAIKKALYALELFPDQAFAYFILAEASAAQKKFADAYEYYSKYEEKRKSTLQAILADQIIPEETLKFKMGKALLNLKMLDEAKKEFEKALKINPNSVYNLIGLANVEFKKNNFSEAKKILSVAKQKDPSNASVSKFLEQIERQTRARKSLAPSTERPLLSLCMIVKNEEKYLEGCLKSVESIASEKIVVDTGSTDGTKEIARKYGAKIVDFPWQEDFAAARNRSIREAAGKWILYLDADERIENPEAVISAINSANEEIGAFIVAIESEHLQLDDKVETHIGGYPRLIRNLGYPKIHFIGRVHEQITPSLLAQGKKIALSDIRIKHLGYNKSRAEMDEKIKRNYKLLIKHVQEEPLNSYAWYQLGQTLAQLRLFKESEEAVRMALQIGNLKPPILASASSTLAHIMGGKGEYEEALKLAEISIKNAPNQVYAWYLKAYALLYLDRLDESEKAFLIAKERLLQKKGIPQAGFDIDIPMETIEKGLEAIALKRKRLESSADF